MELVVSHDTITRNTRNQLKRVFAALDEQDLTTIPAHAGRGLVRARSLGTTTNQKRKASASTTTTPTG